jgi:hypothetical protein
MGMGIITINEGSIYIKNDTEKWWHGVLLYG